MNVAIVSCRAVALRWLAATSCALLSVTALSACSFITPIETPSLGPEAQVLSAENRSGFSQIFGKPMLIGEYSMQITQGSTQSQDASSLVGYGSHHRVAAVVADVKRFDTKPIDFISQKRGQNWSETHCRRDRGLEGRQTAIGIGDATIVSGVDDGRSWKLDCKTTPRAGQATSWNLQLIGQRPEGSATLGAQNYALTPNRLSPDYDWAVDTKIYFVSRGEQRVGMIDRFAGELSLIPGVKPSERDLMVGLAAVLFAVELPGDEDDL